MARVPGAMDPKNRTGGLKVETGGERARGETMPATRKSYPPMLKAKVAVEAIKRRKTTVQIARIYRVHPNLAGKWKQAALAKPPGIFRQPNPTPAAAPYDSLMSV